MFIFPMAGLSRRFTLAGYSQPKYMLEAHGHSLFAHAVMGFNHYFAEEEFLFVCRDVADTPSFIARECRRLGVRNARTVILDAPTAGQAETVQLGLAHAGTPDETPISIFNIDTFRPGFRRPNIASETDGYLEVFRGEGANWSYVRPVCEGSDRVTETTEKVPISDLCCTGLYHFSQVGLFKLAYSAFTGGEAQRMRLTELYIAPMYNLLIRRGFDIRLHLIEGKDVIFCGVPAEYDALLAGTPATG